MCKQFILCSITAEIRSEWSLSSQVNIFWWTVSLRTKEDDLLGVLFPQLTGAWGCRWDRSFFFFPLTVVIREENVFTIRQCLLWSWTASAEPHSVFCQCCGLHCLLVLLVSAVIWINTGPPHQPSGCLLLCCFCPLITSQKFPAQAGLLNMHTWLTYTHMCNIRAKKVSSLFCPAYIFQCRNWVFKLYLSSLLKVCWSQI